MNILKYTCLFLLLSAFALGSCVSGETQWPGTNNEDNLLKVKLNLPAMQKPGTRAMSYEDENTLDRDLLNVIIIKNNNIVSKAQLVGSIIYDENDHSKATITVRLPASEDVNDKIRLCVVANHTIVDVSGNFASFKAAQMTDIADIWPTSQHIPMWGESEDIVVDDAMEVHTIDMYRALARIDVGLNFTVQNNSLTEDAQGLDNFSINSIAVYNTKTRALIAPESLPPITPNVPNGFDRPSNDPLKFGPLGKVKSYVREIYVPEAEVPAPFALNEMHCVIVGGYYNGDTNETFYRLEFAIDDADDAPTFLPLLRNRRYVFNIVDVMGQGYPTPDAAFNGDGSIANRVIEYDLVVLDETIHRIEFKDGYYFGLDDRDLLFSYEAANTMTIKYQTNLTDPQNLTFEWADAGTGAARYNISQDPGTKSFTLETRTENTSGNAYTDILNVKMGQFSIPVTVRQESANLGFSIVGSSVKLNGVYILGETLNASHTITLQVMASDRSIEGKPFVMKTEGPEGDHGISFSASGTFNFDGITRSAPLVMNITMQGSGTLSMNEGSDPFKLRVITNSILGDYHEVTIVPVNPTMNIVVMSNAEYYGYAIDRLNSGSGQVFTSTNNFGPYDHSIVKTSGNYNFINANGVYDFHAATTTNIYKWVTGKGNNGKIADMIYIAYPAFFYANTAQLLVDYMKNGGVIVAFLQYEHTVPHLMNKLFGQTNIGATYEPSLHVIPMPAHPKLFTSTDTEEYKNVLRRFEGDPILNGPFGDIRDLQIGEDYANMASITNLPTENENITVYAHASDINRKSTIIDNTKVTSFKLEEDGAEGCNMFFWGDGGLMSSGYNPIYPHDGQTSSNDNTKRPFWWDTSTFFPVPRPSYGLTTTNYVAWPVYNSTMFCNAMAWGIKKSQQLRERRLEFTRNNPNL